MKELWRDIEGYENLYQVSSKGRVRSLDRVNSNVKGRVLKYGLQDYRYPNVTLHKNGKQISKTIHRLVAIHFVNNPYDKKQVNHINGIRTDNRMENLEWVSPRENLLHAFDTGLASATKGKDHPSSRRIIQLDLDGKRIKEYDTVISAAKSLGIRQGNISNCASGRCKSTGGYKWEYA